MMRKARKLIARLRQGQLCPRGSSRSSHSYRYMRDNDAQHEPPGAGCTVYTRE